MSQNEQTYHRIQSKNLTKQNLQKYEERTYPVEVAPKNMIREIIRVEIADAATEFITKNNDIQPIEQ
jgi:hypothetical protein